jgi:hypothetical protein
MIAMNLDNVAVAHAVDGSNRDWRSARDRRRASQKASDGQYFDQTFHSHPSNDFHDPGEPNAPVT